ncbi:MAG: sulfatase-like hydrolase/transferase [Halioglobus sp.]|nr:sulfatase-like hydrolase/transferase [Halioglobus sp.]
MTRFLWSVLVTVVFLPVYAASARSPNIILILADDIGAEVIGAYGGESYRTPYIDEMAAEGLMFDHGHAQPLSTPSRVKIMTGQYNFRNYRHYGYLEPTQTTFAHLMQEAGYSTAVIGKWELFNNRFEDIEGALPGDAGFDEYIVWQLTAQQRGSRYWSPLIDHNGDVRKHGEHVFGPDVMNKAALDFIEAQRDRPFFLYYPMLLPHAPFVITPQMRDEDSDDQARFAAMVAYMDSLVGKIRDKVNALDLTGNTLVLFIGDNGTDTDIISRYRGKAVVGAKGKTLNTGSRVPFIAWGPGLVVEGRVSASLVNLNDILPTLAELAGVALPETYPGDGVSLVPVFRNLSELPRENLFIHFEPRVPTMRPARYAFDQRWKLYEDGRFYDLKIDPLERRSLVLGNLDREGFVAYRTLQARINAMPGQLDTKTRWVPTVAIVLVSVALLIAVTILVWVARVLRGLQDEATP